MSRPSLVQAVSSQERRLEQLRRLSHLLDNAIALPGTDYRIGLDPFLGLLPGAGDAVGTALSAYIVLQAARWKLPTATLLRMLLNISLDWLLGMVPVLGDLVDAGWKANARNVALLEEHLLSARTAQAADRWVLLLIFALLGLLLALSLALAASLIWGLLQLWGWVNAT
jgi:hypothetical protein